MATFVSPARASGLDRELNPYHFRRPAHFTNVGASFGRFFPIQMFGDMGEEPHR
jgi:hypothetical protein